MITTVSQRNAEELRRKMISPRTREMMKKGGAPLYRINRPDFDRLPLYTFIVLTDTGTEGRNLVAAMRIVKPNNPGKYESRKLTPDKRLIYVFWARDRAVKMLFGITPMLARHIVLPTDPAFEMMDAFKIACDTRRAWAGGMVDFKPTLAYRALGIERLALDISDGPAIVTP